MTDTWIRLIALIKKELQAILGDKQSLRLLIAPTVMQLLIFPFAATLEVNNNTIAIFDQDGGAAVSEIVQRLTQTPAFDKVVLVDSVEQGSDLIDRQKALLLLRFGQHFSESVTAGRPDPIQVILDGRRSNSGQIAISYVQQVLARVPIGGHLSAVTPPAGGLSVRHWYNANLDYFRFILPSLVAMITTLSALIVTAMSVAREREQGTLDQLLVSPLTPGMIFIGKAIPALIVAMIQATIILLGSVYGYGVEFQGSLLLLYLCIFPYVLALVGIGLFISNICATQQQAFLGVFLFVMPAILLSGYVSPVSNMPDWLQTITWANPIRHFIVITKGIYLKAAVLEDFSANLLALVTTGCVTGGVSLYLFHRRLS